MWECSRKRLGIRHLVNPGSSDGKWPQERLSLSLYPRNTEEFGTIVSLFLPAEKLLQWGRPQAGPAFSQVPGGPVTFQWPQRSPLSLQAGPEQPRGLSIISPSSWCPCSWALLGGTTPSQRPSPPHLPPLWLGHRPQTASEVVVMASLVSSIWEVSWGKKENSRWGTGSSGTGLLQFMRQWEVGPWRVRGPLCQLHVGWPWRIASPLSSLGGTGGNRTRSVTVLVPASWCDTVLWLRKVSPWGMDSLFVSLPVS